MNIRQQLKVQAYLDGELSPHAARQVESLLRHDREAKRLYASLKETRKILRKNEGPVALPVSGDYYWSRIEQRMMTLGLPSAPAHAWWPPVWAWLARRWKWLAPAAAAGALLLLMSPAKVSWPHPIDLTGLEVESEYADANVVTFQSEADDITVVWVDIQ